MDDWEDAKCLLCGSAAKSHVFMDPRGQKYDECTGGCPPYAAKGWVHEQIRFFLKLEEKAKIIKFLKEKYANSKHPELFVEISIDDLRSLGLMSK